MASPAPAQPPGIRTISSPPPPSQRNPMHNSSTEGGVIAGLVIGFLACLFLFSVVWSIWMGRRDSRRAAAATPPRPWSPPRSREDGDQQLLRASASSQTALLPAFAYSPSVKHNVTDDGEEAATCSVCLAAFQLGETVRLLPACLHLYHAECIDPWLDAHSTCPLCRSDTADASMEMDVGRLPPV
ncbi:RING-H2 finger protein ATL1-like [Lolium rigidum]|uniref:RING-H2 finger protein ATL1-like n=1 Tax=Lolium rigidum TaxID=89674 RepID=UPI001F5DB403|nr:RING-H2 finger protein ATL1-like [Lolium rigidum]XP_051201952.1 RING-H2 finger protein ATL1-like [Lolium perenne]